MSKLLRLGPKLAFPVQEIATNVVAALGMRGKGKSNLMAVIAEGLLTAGVQVIILDYVGIWFSLRLDETGKRPSKFNVPVLGGPHGDLELLPTAGKIVAESLAASGSSAVLDVSRMSITQRCSFAADLGQALFQAKKDHPSPCFLILEEAQRFIPQMNKLWKGQERMLGAFTEIAEVGRNFGLGLGIVSHRPQKIDTDTLNLAEIGFFFQANGVHERKRIAEWVQEKGAGDRAEVFGELPSIPKGSALVWGTGDTKIYGQYGFYKKSTYDAGATPTAVRASVRMKALDLGKLKASMAELVAESQANDPRALKAEIARLQKELQKKAPAATAPAREVVQVVPRGLEDVIKKAQDGLIALDSDVRAVAERRFPRIMESFADAFGMLVGTIAVKRADQAIIARTGRVSGTKPHLGQIPRPAPVKNKNGIVIPVAAGDVGEKPSGSVLRILGAIRSASMDGGSATRGQIAALLAIRTKGTTLGSYISRARTGGYVTDEDAEGRLALTPKGEHWAPADAVPATGAELVEFWNRKLNAQQQRMLAAAITVGPDGLISRDALADATDIPASGTTFGSYLSRMRTASILLEPTKGWFRAAKEFFR